MLVLSTSIFAQAEKTLLKSVLINTGTASIELPGEVSVSTWDKPYIRVTATIKTTNFTEEVLKRIVSAGRYDIQGIQENGLTIINMPKLVNQVTIGGVKMVEFFKFEVQIPETMDSKVNPVQAQQAM
jgi:recombinational DNA repair protein RecT